MCIRKAPTPKLGRGMLARYSRMNKLTAKPPIEQ